MRNADVVIGALNMNARQLRDWSDEDIAVVLGDVATSYVLTASKLHDQEQ
jgi:3-oxoacyl-[acyl-carrier-protein] synthase III